MLKQDFNVAEAFKNAVLEAKAKKELTKKGSKKANPAADNPLEVARQKLDVGAIGRESTKARLEGRAPSLTQTKQSSSGTLEEFMAAWDKMHPSYGKATGGNGKAKYDTVRQAVRAKAAELVDPNTGYIPPGYVDGLKRKLKAANTEGRIIGPDDIGPDANFDDQVSPSTRNAALNKFPLSGGVDPAQQEDPTSYTLGRAVGVPLASAVTGQDPLRVSHDFEASEAGQIAKRVGETVDQVGPLLLNPSMGGAMFTAQAGMGLGETAVAADPEPTLGLIPGYNSIKTITDPNASPVDRKAGVVSLLIDLLFIGHMAKGGFDNATGRTAAREYSKALNNVSPDEINAALSDIETQHGAPMAKQVSEVLSTFDREAFTKQLQSQEGPLEVGKGALSEQSRIAEPAIPETAPKVEQPSHPVIPDNSQGVKEPWQMTRKDSSDYVGKLIDDAEAHADSLPKPAESWTSDLTPSIEKARSEYQKLRKQWENHAMPTPEMKAKLDSTKAKLDDMEARGYVASKDNLANRDFAAKARAEWLLKNHPDLFEPRPDFPYVVGNETYSSYGAGWHKDAVKAALAEGKPVPDSVLQDYPDLVKPTTEPPNPSEIPKGSPMTEDEAWQKKFEAGQQQGKKPNPVKLGPEDDWRHLPEGTEVEFADKPGVRMWVAKNPENGAISVSTRTPAEHAEYVAWWHKKVAERLANPTAKPSTVETPPVEPQVTPEAPQTGAQPQETTSAVESFTEAGRTVTGGTKGKTAGAARLIDPVDRIKGIAQALRTSAKSIGRNVRDPRRVVAQLFGDTFQNIQALAPKNGKDISGTLNRALVDATSRTAKLVGRVHEAIVANYGKGYASSAEARAALGLDGAHGIVAKVRRGEKLTAKESAVWKQVVASSKELGDSAAQAGALVERVSGADQNPRIVGKSVRWGKSDGMRQGKVLGFDKAGNVRVEIDGVETSIPAGERYWTRSVVEDSTYFPDKFKDGVEEALADPNSPEFKLATEHLLKTGKAKTEAQARAIVNSLVHPTASVSTPVSSALRKPRMGNMLPESFFETDLLKVLDDHVARASMDVAGAEHFGPEYKKLADMLAKVPSSKDRTNIGSLVKRAMGSDTSVADDALAGLAHVEGSYTALTKLGANLGSAVNNLGQLMTNITVHGTGSSMKSVWKVVTDKNVRKDIKLSGANQADFLALQGFADLTGLPKTAMHVAMTPFRILDSFARNTGSWAGLVATKDALRRVSVKDGKFAQNAPYRYLRDVMKYSDGDIARMKADGMTDLDRYVAFQGGQSAQIGSRKADLPNSSHTALGKMVWRLQTFNIGQAKWLNYAVSEAAKGNITPAARLAVSSVIAGEGIMQARGLIDQYVKGKQNEEPDKAKAAFEAVQRGDWKPLLERAMVDWGRSGVMGIYGVPIEAAGKPWAADSFQPPISRTLYNVFVDSALYSSKTEGEFIDKVKAYTGNLLHKEVVALGNLYKVQHGGKSFRQDNPIKKDDK